SGDTQVVNTAGEGVSTTAPRTPPTTTVFDDEDVTMAMAQTLIKMKQEKAKEKGVAIKDVEDSSRPIRSITTLQPLSTIDPKDKGKGILQETKPVEKTKKKVQDDVQIERDAKARIDANYELAARMTQEEQEKVAGSYATQKTPKKPKVMKSAKDKKEKEELMLMLEKMEAKDMYVYKLTRADGSSSYHRDTQAFIRRLDRQDLNDLYSCGVHTLFMDGTLMEINMLVKKKYPLIKELLEKMLNLQLEAKEESIMAFELIKFIKSLLEE
ncbi:hypothetical protein Tco_1190721, partial [Tanacetum coccineum]